MELWDLNLRHLRAVVEIAERGTMNAAAEAVSLTQPAITQALARLEQMLDFELFERRHDGMVPTEAATLLVPRIKAALDHVASPNVTIARLRALIALADSGSYGGASALTGLSMPSLHRAVNDLSLSMRRPLVERAGKIVVLTEAGQQVARSFRLARAELEAGLSEIRALKGHETRQIAIGAMPLSRARILPAAIARFLRRHPQVKVSIIEGSRGELVEPLRNATIDLMVGAVRDPMLEPDLVQRPLFEDRPAVLARVGHPLTGHHPSIQELASYSWVVAGPGTPLRSSWERMFNAAGQPLPPVPVESGSVMIIRNLLVHSDFLTLLSPDQVAVELEAGWLQVIAPAPPELSRTIGVTTRASWRPTAVQADFLADLNAVAEAG